MSRPLDNIEQITGGIVEVLGDFGKGLTDFLNRLTGEKENRPTSQEKKEALAAIKTWGNFEADEAKRRALDDSAELIKGSFSFGDRGHEPAQVDRHSELELTIPVPQWIRDFPDYETLLARQRVIVAQELAKYEEFKYGQAAGELDAEPLADGQEVEGEILEVAQVDGENFYIIDQDGDRVAVPAGDNPEYQQGDEISVTRESAGFEIAESYGYSR
jgi:hypothetical protein